MTYVVRLERRASVTSSSSAPETTLGKPRRTAPNQTDKPRSGVYLGAMSLSILTQTIGNWRRFATGLKSATKAEPLRPYEFEEVVSTTVFDKGFTG
jgi:hypothetical protein